MTAKRRKIGDIQNENERQEIRKQWRDAKRIKKQSRVEEPAVVEIKSRRRYRCKVAVENLKLKQKLKTLSVKNENLKKKLIRSFKKIRILTLQLNDLKSKTDTTMTVTSSENQQESFVQEINGLSPNAKSNIFINEELPNIAESAKQKVKQKLFQHHVLEESLKETYQDSKPYKERDILKKLVESDYVKKYNMQINLTKFLGLKSGIRRYYTIKKKRMMSAKQIKDFFERDDVSRMTAGKKECLTLKKNKKQKRFLLNTLPKLYEVYKNEGGKLSYSTFKRYRPFYIVPPNLSDRNTCACVKHANLAFKADTLKKLGVIETSDLNDLVSEIVCDVKSKSCMYSECTVCSCKKLTFVAVECPEEVSWFEWTTKSHEFVKSGQRKLTKRTVKEKQSGSLKTLTDLLQNDLIKFKLHHFNIYHQYKQYKEAIQKLQENEVIIHCDFSENYACKMGEEVQSMHFGASKIQISLHTGVVYIKKEKPLSFCTISPSLKHGPEAIWGHLEPVLCYVKKNFPIIDCIHFFSDGPTTQYRQKNNFFLFSENIKNSGFVHATWSFFEASHGKGAADGVGGAIKRSLDRRVAYGDDIVDAKSAFEALSRTETTIKTFYVDEQNIEDIKISSPEKIYAVPSTMKVHQIISTDDKNVIKYRPLSCFCTRGYCNCFSTKLHNLKPIKLLNIKRKTPTEGKKKEKINRKFDSSSENTDAAVHYAESNVDSEWNKSKIVDIDKSGETRNVMKLNMSNKKRRKSERNIKRDSKNNEIRKLIKPGKNNEKKRTMV